MMISDLDDAKKGEEDPQQKKKQPPRISAGPSTGVDPAPYFQASIQKKKEVVGMAKHSFSPQRYTSKKKKALNFREWTLGGSKKIDKAQFEEIQQKMTPTQRQNLYLDRDGRIRVRHGGSLEEAEYWYHKRILPRKNIHEGVLNYLDCKVSPIWASYQSSGKLTKIRAEVNEELKRLKELDDQAMAAAARENL
ncbi:unnamed protein product [Cuscuta europaea]|uniref:Uncharacterized protein n=1 Tax=Cuscuta europaea TaxID=41803 RepID=A0A9P0ZW72_CUSEU|nr:unnamed protein product [Cuscuta europaea]